MMRRTKRLALLLASALAAVPIAAAFGAVDPALLAGMKWRQVGPFRGGRVLAVTGVPGDPTTWYFGGVAGGVWKSTNAGSTWQPTFDGQPIASIGAIAVAEADHNVVYAGSGEACPRGNITYGDGVYKSVDAGRSWRNIGLKDSQHIGRIAVHPKNPEVLLVAALGHIYGPNEERGIFRSADGGKSWQKVLYRDAHTGGIDVVFDPDNPSIAFASLWQVDRTPWSLSSGGPGSGLYKSVDGGQTWRHLEGQGLPEGLLGRIGVAVPGGGSGRVYAIIEAQEGGIFRSEDGGEHWSRVNPDHRFRQRAWYYSHIYADPVSPDVLYVSNTGLFRSGDGGRSFELVPAPHGDHHGLWIDPRDPRHLIEGSDGGASVSVDGGRSWTQPYNQPTAQFYHVAVDNHWPYRVYGAQQDNSTVGIASRDDDGVIGRQDWFPVGGGESGYIAPDPNDPEIIYAGSEGGIITRYDHRTNNLRDASVYPLDVSGNGAESLKFRQQWTEPVLVSRHDSNVLYTAAQVVFRSQDQGRSWQAVSPDLTRNDKSKQKPSGGPITLDITSVEYYDTVFTLAESPRQRGLLWAGTDDGLIHLTRDDGAHWENVTPKELPAWSMVSLIEASAHDAGTAYAAIDRHKLDDAKPLIFRTHDFGKTWTRIATGIPDGAYVRAVREDPTRAGLLYAGTELGVYVSVDDGAHWQPLKLNLPTVPVHDLAIKDGDLVAATHGRSFWILDDLSPLRQAAAVRADEDFHLFTPATAVRIHVPQQVERRLPSGDNPPPGAVIDYYLKAAPTDKEEIVLEFLDAGGAVLKRFSNRKRADLVEQPAEWVDREAVTDTIPAAAGANRFAWDFRREDPVAIPGAFYSDDGPRGPVVIPGHYQVRLTVHGQSQTVPLEIVLDPRLKGQVGERDLAALDDLAMRTWRDIDALHRAVNQIRDTRGRLQTLQKWSAGRESAKPVLAAADALIAKMAPIEGRLVQVQMAASEDNLRYPNMLNEQYDTFISLLDSDWAPTQPEREVYAYLHGELDGELAKWRALATHDLPALNALLHQHGVPAIGDFTAP
ncbi:MAG: glycosyl hydrolase [Proteobacteria bacterium]|nr:glycosyl hydrolase [Pseudomonadota bacterium]